MKTDEQLIFESSIQLKKKLVLPQALAAMLMLFEKGIKGNGDLGESTKSKFFQSNSQLKLAFNKLNRGQKIYHYSQCVQFLNSIVGDKMHIFKPKVFEQPCVHVVAYKNTGLLGFSEKTMVIIDNKNRRLVLTSSGKKEQKIKLRNFLMRQSKDAKKHCLIFESIVKYQFRSSLRLYFEQHVYPEAKIILRRLLDEVEKQKLYQELTRSVKPSSLSLPDVFSTVSSPQFSFLNKQNLRSLNNLITTSKQNQQEEHGVQRMQILKYSYKTITTNGNVYYLQQLFYLPKNEVINILSLKEHQWNGLLIDSSVSETSGNETAFVESYLLDDIKYTTSYIMHQKDDRLILMSVKNQEIQNGHQVNIDFMHIKVIKITDETTQICIRTRIQTLDQNRQKFVVEFLKQFSNIYQVAKSRSKKSVLNIQNDTIYYDANGQAQEQIGDYFNLNQESHINFDQTCFNSSIKEIELGVSTNYGSETDLNLQNLQCLKYKHFLKPRENAELKIAKQHYLDAEWVRNKHGGLLCINERLLTQQKKVLKHIFSSIGKNLFNSKSIMNISLPASVCTKCSHLKMVANNFIYAPLLVQTSLKMNPLERMKSLVTFLITIGNTGIASQKPFNPILGQTFEGIINGCPIYLQQISHHPAASAYYLDGRGYKITGVIEPKVQPTGINSVRCYSQRQNKILFDDGSKVYMSFPKISLRGLLFGNRQFLFEGKNYLYDDKNNLYSQISFGPQRSIFGTTKQDQDIIFGSIYKVTPHFKQVFNSQKRKDINLQDFILQQISTFSGSWAQSIQFDKKPFFDFRTQLPCILQQYSHPLPSDSQFRTDIQKLCQNNIKQAQSQKQRLQDLQRKDKTLRQKNKIKKSK